MKGRKSFGEGEKEWSWKILTCPTPHVRDGDAKPREGKVPAQCPTARQQRREK